MIVQIIRLLSVNNCEGPGGVEGPQVSGSCELQMRNIRFDSICVGGIARFQRGAIVTTRILPSSIIVFRNGPGETIVSILFPLMRSLASLGELCYKIHPSVFHHCLSKWSWREKCFDSIDVGDNRSVRPFATFNDSPPVSVTPLLAVCIPDVTSSIT